MEHRFLPEEESLKARVTHQEDTQAESAVPEARTSNVENQVDKEQKKNIERHKTWRDNFAIRYEQAIVVGGPFAAAAPLLVKYVSGGMSTTDPSTLHFAAGSFAGVCAAVAVGFGITGYRTFRERQEFREAQSKLPISMSVDSGGPADSLSLPFAADSNPSSPESVRSLIAEFDRQIEEARALFDECGEQLAAIQAESVPYVNEARTHGEAQQRAAEVFHKGHALRERRKLLHEKLLQLYERRTGASDAVSGR